MREEGKTGFKKSWGRGSLTRSSTGVASEGIDSFIPSQLNGVSTFWDAGAATVPSSETVGITWRGDSNKLGCKLGSEHQSYQQVQ